MNKIVGHIRGKKTKQKRLQIQPFYLNAIIKSELVCLNISDLVFLD